MKKVPPPQIDKVWFEELIIEYKINAVNSFVNYLAEIWKDWARRSNEKSKGINRITFSRYYDLPGWISKRLFNIFDSDQNDFLSPKEFINGMMILFTGSFDILSQFIFNFYDFDNDGEITKEDVRVALSYVPLQTHNFSSLKLRYEAEDFSDRVESQDELFKILDKSFGDKETLNMEEFVNVIENVSSDIFVFILVFMLEKRPFNNETIKWFEILQSEKGNANVTNQCQTPSPVRSQKIVLPSTTSKFKSPMLLKNKNFSESRTRETRPWLSLYSGKKQIEEDLNDYNDDEIVDNLGYKNNIITNSTRRKGREIWISWEEEQWGKKTEERASKFKGEIIKVVKEETNDFDLDDEFSEDETPFPPKISSNIASHEGYLLKITSDQKIKKMYFRWIFKDIYFYKNKEETKHMGMHNLSGAYIKENIPFDYNDLKYFSFTFTFAKKTRTYYSDNEREYRKWIEKWKSAIDFSDISDWYEMKEQIGKGKFSIVKKGIHKATKRWVSIKIINKQEMEARDWDWVKTEMDVLKISQHPNIIKLYDIWENEEFIYIIMEFCGGGDWFSYLQKREFKISERRACEIVHKWLVAMYYIHSYGIIHRDLKPENIWMTDSIDNADIRLLDFGLSKIIGPNELCSEPFGTISYAAPEVLQGKFYDKSADLWSIGVITYLLLTGCLPFDDENSQEEIVRQTIHDPVPYYKKCWKNISKEGREFVEGLWQKESTKRMSIKQALESEWVNKFNQTAKIRRESQEVGSHFKIYTSIINDKPVKIADPKNTY